VLKRDTRGETLDYATLRGIVGRGGSFGYAKTYKLSGETTEIQNVPRLASRVALP
jgi:hypothetical protein